MTTPDIPPVLRAYDSGMSDNRSKNALLIAASRIAAMRLAGEEIKATPRVLSAVSDRIRLAQISRIERDSGA